MSASPSSLNATVRQQDTDAGASLEQAVTADSVEVTENAVPPVVPSHPGDTAPAPATVQTVRIPTPEVPPIPKHLDPVEALRLSLDEDEDTSLVASLCLHMLSEHGVQGTVHLDHDALSQLHIQIHQLDGQDHAVSDWRFRPQRALRHALVATPEVDASEPFDALNASQPH